MHWWPRQTPRIGTRPAKVSITSMLIPADSGRPGPGEMTMASGRSAAMPGHVDGVVAVDDRLGAELAQLLDEVVDEGVVVVDEQDPGAHGPAIVTAGPR